jgi:uncharacterized damage-inducible protein DinB
MRGRHNTALHPTPLASLARRSRRVSAERHAAMTSVRGSSGESPRWVVTMDKQELQQLLDYHYWARDRILDAAERLSPGDFTRDLGSSFKSIRDTLVHTYSAEWIWCERWQGRSPTSMFAADAFDNIPSLRSAWAELEVALRSVVDRFVQDGLAGVVEYRDTRGKRWHQVFWHMVQHVVNHASYHRGQVTTMLRQLQARPPDSMDLITYYRLRNEPAA